MYTAITYENFRKYLGLEPDFENDNPVAEHNLKKLEQLMFWLYGSSSKKITPVIESQNPDLRHLNEVLGSKEATEYYNDLYNRMEIRYGDMKKQMAADANKLLTPIREKIIAFSSDDALLDRIMRQGAEAASARAEKTIEEVREIIGFRKI